MKTEVKYLGIVVTRNRREEANITNRVEDMKKRLSHWLLWDLSIFGRALISKAEGLSKCIYPSNSLYISPKPMKAANSVIFNFLWRNKTHYIRKSQLVKEYKSGGLNALEFESLVGTFKINWLKACLSNPTSMWFHIPWNIFKKIGGLDLLLKCDFEVGKLPLKLSDFHKQILLYWKIVFTHNFSPHGATLWNNRVITVSKKSLFKYEWYDKGIVFVKDLLYENGSLLEYNDFIVKFNIDCTYREFNKICKAIPCSLLMLIRNSLRNVIGR